MPDKFGGIALDEAPSTDKFGGVSVDEAPPEDVPVQGVSMADVLRKKPESYFTRTPVPQTAEEFATAPMGGELQLVREPKTAVEGLYNTLAKAGGSMISPLGVAVGAVAPLKAAQPILAGTFGGLGAKGAAESLGHYLGTPNQTTGQALEDLGDTAANVLMAGAPVLHVAAEPLLREIANLRKKGTPDATQERLQQEGRQPEYPGTTPLGVSTETGGGNRPVTETPVQAQEVVTAATYTNPKTGETTTAPNHIEAAAEQGVEAPKSREGRETKDFGFQVQEPATGKTEVVSRDEAETVARESGQLKEEPKGEKVHSDEIALAPAKPTEAVASPTVAASTPEKQVEIQGGEPAVDELAKYRGEIWISADPNVYIGVGDSVVQANDRGFGVPEGMKGKITDIGVGHGGNAYPVVTWENGKKYRYEPDSLSDLRKISPEQGTASAAELGAKPPPPAQGLKTERQVEQGVKPAPEAPVTPPPPPQVAKGTEVVPAKSGERVKSRKLLPAEQEFLDKHGITIKDAVDSGLIRVNKKFRKDGTEVKTGYSPSSADSWEFTSALEAANKEKEIRAKSKASADPDKALREEVWSKMTDQERRTVRQNPKIFDKPEGALDWEFLRPYAEKQGVEAPKPVSHSQVEKDLFTSKASAPTTPPSTGEGMAGGIGQGPGGKTYKPSAKPEPTESFEATSLKNAVAELEAAGVGHNLTPAEKHAMAPLWDQAGAILKSDPNAGQRLADDLIANPERGMTDADSALLLRHKVGLMNELNNAAERTHVGDAEARAQADREYMQKSDELKSLLDAVKKRGTQWGREGRWRQAMAYEDYTFATQEGLLRAAKGGLPLTEGERTKLLADIEAYKKNAAEQEALRIKREGEAVELKKEIDNLIKNAPTFDKRILAQAEKIVQGMEKFAKPAADRLRARLANLGTSPDPAIIYDAAVVGSAKIARLGLDLAKFTDDMIRDFGEKLRPMIPQIWAEANKMLESNLAKEPELVKRAVKKQNVAEVKTAVTEKIADKVKRGKLDEVTWYVQKLARVFVQSGIRDREQLIDAVHDTIKDVIPGITRRKTMDAISGYGDFKQLSKDQITVTLRGMKGEMQQLAKLEDMAKGQPPLKSGLERRTPTEAERKLIKEVNDAKNKFQVPVQDPSTQLKSALDTLKTTLTNRIKDLSDRIAKGDFEKRPRRQVALDPEAAKLMAQGVEIQKRFRKARYEAEQAQRSPAKKFVDRYVTGLYNSLRSIAVMGHGTVGMFTHAGGLAWRASTAGIWARNFIRQFPMWAKPAYHEQLIHRLKTDPDYYTWLKAGAKIDPDLMYEDYAKYGKALGKLAAGGQRGFDSLKLARLELNKAQWDKVSDDIKADPEQAQATRKAIAEMNNKATGTSPVFGKVGGADVSTVAHSLFFAPQLYASRWSRVLLDPIKTLATFRDWNKATPAERYIATTRVKHAAEFAAVYVGSLVVNQALLSASGSTQKVNFTDPTKSDWLKFKAHGKIVTADGGLLDPVRLMGQIVYGDLIKARTAQERHLQGTRFEKAIKDVGKYLRSKFNPSLGLVVDASTGQDFSGRAVPFSDEPSKYKSQHRYTWGEWIMSHGPIPLGLGTRIAYEEMQKRGLSKPDAAAILEGAAAASIGMTGVHETEDYSKKP